MMCMRISYKSIFLSILALTAITVTLFQHREFTIESWGYWFFARILAETGKFTLIERSPPYIIYLNLFRIFPYPYSVILEYIVTTFIAVIGIAYIFKPYLGRLLSFFAAIIWIPFMQVSEPPVQKIALLLSGLGIYLRIHKKDRYGTCLSYSLLILACLFRMTYFVFILIFITFDLFRIFKNNHFKILGGIKPNLKTDWPLVLVIGMYILFQLLKSPLLFNNVYFSNAKWFPNNGKSFEFLQVYNDEYIWEKYHTYVDHDFYFTNKELFGGATTSFSAFKNNPDYVIQKITRNFKNIVFMINRMTFFSKIFALSDMPVLVNFLFILFIFYGALIGSTNVYLFLYLLGNITMLLLLAIFTPSWRYFFPLIPIFITSSLGYGKLISKKIGQKWFIPTTAILLVLLSPNFTKLNYDNSAFLDWIEIGKQIISDAKIADLKILNNRTTSPNSISMNTSYSKITPLISNCKGILSKEILFIAAFSKYPIDQIHDIWEIPPFASLNNSEYKGLNPQRVDCLFLSKDLSFGEGGSTNQQIRYQYYLKPYQEDLIKKGAKNVVLDSYGTVTKLYQ